MKAISLHLEDEIYIETEKLISDSKISRNKYINEAIAYYNQIKRKYILANKFKEASAIVSDSTLETLNILEEIDDDYEKI